MNDVPMGDPGLCPLLSGPATRDRKGAEIPPVLVSCRKEECPLYRAEKRRCALYEVPDVLDGVAALGESAESGLNSASETFQASVARVSRFLEGWQKTIEGAGHRFSEIQREIERTAARSAAEIHGVAERMEQAGLRQDRLLQALDRVLLRLDEERRSAEADRLAREGEDLLARGDLQKALFLLQKARGTLGGHPRLQNALGCVFLRLSRWEEAVTALQACRTAQPALPAARVNLGYALFCMNRHDEAARELMEALALDPGSAAAWNTLGNVRFSTGESGEAVECWLRAVERDPGLEAAWENLRRQQVLENRPFGALVAGAEEAPATVSATASRDADA